MNYDAQPVSRIVWVDINFIYANDYNPNVVLTPEMKLLKYSLLYQGWIQPLLVAHQVQGGEQSTYEIIDGFHRWNLAKTDRDVNAMTGGKVPVVDLTLSEAERMLLTIRINRAKGTHVAVKMHEIVYALFHEHNYSVAQISQGIGADKHEVNTLLMKNVFEKKKVATTSYSKAWVPKLAK